MYGNGYYGIDISYILLVLPAIAISLFAQIKVKSTYSKYSQVLSQRGITANAAAQAIMRENGIDLPIVPITGELTDNYNPQNKTLNLSTVVYGSSSIAAIGVAAHEVGHAIQDATGYGPLKLRSNMVGICNLGSRLSMPLIIIGLILNSAALCGSGILLFSLAVLFQLVTLPVEFNASRRALASLSSQMILSDEELAGAKQVLNAAALTYVGALLVSFMQLLRLVLMYRRNNR